MALVASGVGPGSRDTDLHRSILRAGWQMRRDHGVVDPLALAQAVRERNPDCGWSDAELDRRCENVLAEIDRVSDEMTRVSFEWDESVSLSDRLTVVLSDSLRRPITVDWLAWRCGLTRHPTSVSGRARAAVRLELRGLCGPGGPFARVRKGSPGVGSVYERRETIAV